MKFCQSAMSSTVIRAGAIGWTTLTVAFLMPLWFFPYIPTQDGPAHLANSVLLRDIICGNRHAIDHFWINWRPLPNWGCFALLAGLASALPPLIAEKVLVSLYAIGSLLAYRYFVYSLRTDGNLPCLAGFVLTFDYCFWMGFYNYCLSSIGLFVGTGFLLRRRSRLDLGGATVLCSLLTATYLTHLVGFILTAASCLWLSLAPHPRRWRDAFYVAVSLLPGIALAGTFFDEAHYTGDGVFRGLSDYLLGWIWGSEQWGRLAHDFSSVGANLLGTHLDLSLPVGMFYIELLSLFMLVGLFSADRLAAEERSRRRSVATLGLAFALLYFALPDIVVFGKGGFWKARLAPLPALLWLSCVRLPSARPLRRLLAALSLLTLVCCLWGITYYCWTCNEVLREFASEARNIGRERALISVVRGGRVGDVNPLKHAGEYYCLAEGNINLGHNFNDLKHSVVRLQPVAHADDTSPQSRGYPHWKFVDTVVYWSDSQEENFPPGFSLVFEDRRLKILRRADGRRPR